MEALKFKIVKVIQRTHLISQRCQKKILLEKEDLIQKMEMNLSSIWEKVQITKK